MKSFFATPSDRLLWYLVIAGILPTLYFCARNSINYDVAWLIEATQRILQGGSIYKDAFDVTPPLYLLVMIPPVAVAALTGIPVYYSVIAYTLILIFLSVAACRVILEKWDFLSAGDRNVFCGVLLLACLILPSADFGEKDHLILTGLVPLTLVQLSLTLRYELPRGLKRAVLAVSVLLIITKPHYGLLPTLLLVHRMIAQRRFFSIMRDADFLALASGTIAGAATIFVLFPSYITQVLPDVIGLYLSSRSPKIMDDTLYYSAFIGIFALLYSFLPAEKPKRNFVLFLFFAAAVNLVPFYVQGKGYWYHLLPAQVFYFTAMAMALQTVLERFAPRVMPQALTVLCMTALLYLTVPLNPAYTSHADVKNFEITKAVSECAKPCTFFVFNSNMGIMHVTAVYADREHGSRFSAYWFLPGILKRLAQGDKDAPTFRDRYAKMVGEDFQRYQPETVLLGQFPLEGPDKGPFDFPAFFSADPAFAQEWSHYDYVRTIDVNEGDYYRGTVLDKGRIIPFMMYRRRAD